MLAYFYDSHGKPEMVSDWHLGQVCGRSQARKIVDDTDPCVEGQVRGFGLAGIGYRAYRVVAADKRMALLQHAPEMEDWK